MTSTQTTSYIDVAKTSNEPNTLANSNTDHLDSTQHSSHTDDAASTNDEVAPPISHTITASPLPIISTSSLVSSDPLVAGSSASAPITVPATTTTESVVVGTTGNADAMAELLRLRALVASLGLAGTSGTADVVASSSLTTTNANVATIPTPTPIMAEVAPVATVVTATADVSSVSPSSQLPSTPNVVPSAPTQTPTPTTMSDSHMMPPPAARLQKSSIGLPSSIITPSSSSDTVGPTRRSIDIIPSTPSPPPPSVTSTAPPVPSPTHASSLSHSVRLPLSGNATSVSTRSPSSVTTPHARRRSEQLEFDDDSDEDAPPSPLPTVSSLGNNRSPYINSHTTPTGGDDVVAAALAIAGVTPNNRYNALTPTGGRARVIAGPVLDMDSPVLAPLNDTIIAATIPPLPSNNAKSPLSSTTTRGADLDIDSDDDHDHTPTVAHSVNNVTNAPKPSLQHTVPHRRASSTSRFHRQYAGGNDDDDNDDDFPNVTTTTTTGATNSSSNGHSNRRRQQDRSGSHRNGYDDNDSPGTSPSPPRSSPVPPSSAAAVAPIKAPSPPTIVSSSRSSSRAQGRSGIAPSSTTIPLITSGSSDDMNTFDMSGDRPRGGSASRPAVVRLPSSGNSNTNAVLSSATRPPINSTTRATIIAEYFPPNTTTTNPSSSMMRSTSMSVRGHSLASTGLRNGEAGTSRPSVSVDATSVPSLVPHHSPVTSPATSPSISTPTSGGYMVPSATFSVGSGIAAKKQPMSPISPSLATNMRSNVAPSPSSAATPGRRVSVDEPQVRTTGLHMSMSFPPRVKENLAALSDKQKGRCEGCGDVSISSLSSLSFDMLTVVGLVLHSHYHLACLRNPNFVILPANYSVANVIGNINMHLIMIRPSHMCSHSDDRRAIPGRVLVKADPKP
jgi:hypothetical protein